MTSTVGHVKCLKCQRMLLETKIVGNEKQLVCAGFTMKKAPKQGEVTLVCSCGAEARADTVLFNFA